MLVIDIAKQFAQSPGARYYSDGPKSGQEFYEKMLKESFQKAKSEGEKLKIILDGTDGYASSFLNEAFGLLGTNFGSETVWNNLVIISNEVPKYITKVKESIYEKR